MKRTLLFMIILYGFSCRTKQAEKIVLADTTAPIINKDTGIIKDSHYFWTSELVNQQGLVMKKTRPIRTDSLNAESIIGILNDQYPEIRLTYIKVSNDSIFLKISKSSYLTQKMGTSGADAYLAEVTYNLTELNGINYIAIRFREGDHASPGVYSRTDFVRERSGINQ